MRLLFHVICMSALLLTLPAASASPLRVAVAANFATTARSLGSTFEAASGQRVEFSVASTGVLVSQILHGAPFDVFLSADAQSPTLLASNDKAVPGSQFCYAAGKLVLLGGTLQDLQSSDKSLAVANPTTAPYGRAAFEVLARKPLDVAGKRRLLRGSNVLQAYQFWTSGGADLALVAASIAGGNGIEIPGEWHTPIEQHATLLSGGRDNPAATEFLSFLASSAVETTIVAAGYRPCS